MNAALPQILGVLGLATLLATGAAGAQDVDRSRPPELQPPPSFTPPPVQRFTLSNGLQVLLVEKHQVPLAQVNLLVRAGSVDNPVGRGGLASMVAAMLDEGAGGRNALELADAIEFLGATLEVGAGDHTTAVRLHTPLAKLDDALGLMADVALRPDFPSEELERQRRERLTDLLQAHDEPRAIAAVAFSRAVYGDDHPYGAPQLGTEASLRAMTVEDLAAFHRRGFVAARSTLIVAGDVTEASLRPRLESAFGAMPGGMPGIDEVDDAPQVTARRVVIVDKPGAAQSEIRIGRIGVARTSEDYYALEVMNTILGGSFSARLNQNLREDKGYSYGAFSYFDYRPHPGPFVAQAAVQTEVTDKALVEFMNELRGIVEVADAEVARARNYIALGFPGSFQTVAGTAGMTAPLALYDLPLDYYGGYVSRVQAVTIDDVRRVAGERIDPDAVEIVVVGDASRIEAGVRALDLGPVTVLSVEDVLGPAPRLSGSPAGTGAGSSRSAAN